MTIEIVERVRDTIASGRMTRAGLARLAGLHVNTLRDAGDPDWNPTADTLAKLARVLDQHEQKPVLASAREIIEEARNGRMFILVDDEDRENEGDLVIPAQMATPDAINFMAVHGRGLICLALSPQRVAELGLQPMSRDNRTAHGTAFTTSIEAREGISTGISVADRARTISVAIDSARGPDDIVTPGHVFPLMAREGGVLVRAGHTEAAVDIARLAGLNPSGVICEIMNDDGSMARMDDLVRFARQHRLKIGTIRDLIEYRRQHDHLVDRLEEADFHSDYGGAWRLITYRNSVDGSVSHVLQKGEIVPGEPTLVRMHSLSIFDDVLGRSGPNKRVLQRAMTQIGKHGSGVVVILSAAAFAASGAQPEPHSELRSHGIGAQILADLGVEQMILLTNSHRTIVAIEGYGLQIVGEVPLSE
ncbi:3,4-dihydroxy-2-butanone-4-phosphate synthase [Erythrobacteraceae bacterium CFH 75059]|uniref:3,4-dihydroxy-2-butanone-4-phosphate synthase n=1 Tax=Qipengyuania thermophila TaxID=2509361 RepID=UPI001020870E|nr:3,4-dihydroxy-2-butanone-4-phosphate synthase [Qipengyuania thermophila]TCD05139.1 3,4-dihydroxy-2-butanone-4-phosphate synthase [Erythrobacteraceae bacterium CFH 75059]